MYQYIDCHGNTYSLLSESQRLRYVSRELIPAGAATPAMPVQESALTDEQYMQLVSAFVAAIDNRLQQLELCNKCSGTVLATVDGQQRRYILSGQSSEMQDLEALLLAGMEG